MGCLSWLQVHCPVGAPRWGWVAVQLGLFFLTSSALLGGLLLLASVVLVTWHKGFTAYWSDGLNRVLLVVAGLILIGATQAVSGGFAWLVLLYWLLLFWCFWGWQAYLETPEARRRCSGWLVAGTVPVLITGLGQMVLGWRGPWSMAGDLIIWYVAPGGNPEGRLSGLFGHANNTAAWLALTWPLVLTHLLESRLTWGQRGVVLVLAVLQSSCLWLTASRNGWGAMILAVPLLLGPWSWLLPLLLLALIPIVLAILPADPLSLQELAQSVVPNAIWQRFAAESFQNRALGDTRLEMWAASIQLILERPWLGWGAIAFGQLYSLRMGFSGHFHPHNLPLDLGVSFGLPAALLLLATCFWIVMKVVRSGMFTTTLMDRGWLAAFLLLASIHATDLPDERTNVAGWFLLAGLRAYGLAAPQRRLTGAMSGGAQTECRFSSSN